jgi:hypothetical protein
MSGSTRGEAFISLVKNGGDDQVIMEDSARERTAAYWENNRPEQLSVNEQNVYKMMDTLNSMSLFQTYRNTIDFLFSGRKKLGK